MYIVMLNGHVACLKTTLSYLLAPALGLAHISTSVLGPFEPRREASDFFSLRDKRYRIAAEIADAYLRLGVSIILDGTYALRRWRNDIYNLACMYNSSDVVAISCICSRAEILRERFDYRAHVLDAPDAKSNQMEAYEASVREFEPIHDDKLPDGRDVSHIEFDSGTFEVIIRKSNTRQAESIAAVLEDFVKSGHLAKPFFGLTSSKYRDIVSPKNSTNKSLWVAIEGIGGSGKTTQCRRLAAGLRSLFPDRQILVVDEFTNTSLGQFLRSHVADNHEFRIQISKEVRRSYLESLLVIADSMQKVNTLSRSELWDICILDGFRWTHVAHAVALLPRKIADELQEQIRTAVEVLVARFPSPPGRGFTFFLNAPAEIALRSLEARIGSSLRLEHLTFLRQLATAYRAIVEMNPDIHLVDATQPEEAVTETLLKVLIPYLN